MVPGGGHPPGWPRIATSASRSRRPGVTTVANPQHQPRDSPRTSTARCPPMSVFVLFPSSGARRTMTDGRFTAAGQEHLMSDAGRRAGDRRRRLGARGSRRCAGPARCSRCPGPGRDCGPVLRLSVVGGVATGRRWYVDGDAASGVGAAWSGGADGVGAGGNSRRAGGPDAGCRCAVASRRELGTMATRWPARSPRRRRLG